MLNWVQRFNIFCLLDNQQYQLAPHNYEYILGAGCAASIGGNNESFSSIDAFLNNEKWTFGHLSYDLGYAFQNIKTKHKNPFLFPDFFFFQPQVILFIKNNQLHIEGNNPDEIYNELMAVDCNILVQNLDITIQQKLTKEAYIQKIKALLKHLQRGDCYEINFCQEFFAEDVVMAPAAVFEALSKASPTPFSAFYKWNAQYLICASPERFLTRNKDQLLSQPMKGTARRIPGDKTADEQVAKALCESAKDRAENVMVVDLVRNDLSKICKEGSVKVAELFRIDTFPAVHQMVSTITGGLKKDVSFSEIIEALFPMGSMTGAPKKRVMQLIEEYECSSRGIFSGAVGYIAPDGNFDFGVVIRSILYNAGSGYLSYSVGSGITIYSNPENEWEECLLKGERIKKVLTSASTIIS